MACRDCSQNEFGERTVCTAVAEVVPPARPAHLALAAQSDAVSRLDLRSDAAADPGGNRNSLLRALHDAFSQYRSAGCGAARRGAASLDRLGLLRTRAQP